MFLLALQDRDLDIYRAYCTFSGRFYPWIINKKIMFIPIITTVWLLLDINIGVSTLLYI